MADKETSEISSTFEDTSDEGLKPNLRSESLILKLEIGSSVQDMVIHDTDHPQEAVSKFCEQNNLSPEVEKVLLEKVLQNLTRHPSPCQVQRQVKFIKIGNFIKKEVPVRGRSAIRSGINLSPCKSATREEGKSREGSVVKNKFKLDSSNRILAKPKQHSTRM